MPTSKRTRKYGPKRAAKADIKECMRPARICRHCGAAETLTTYTSKKVGVVRVSWARCSDCNRVTKEKTVIA